MNVFVGSTHDVFCLFSYICVFNFNIWIMWMLIMVQGIICNKKSDSIFFYIWLLTALSLSLPSSPGMLHLIKLIRRLVLPSYGTGERFKPSKILLQPYLIKMIKTLASHLCFLKPFQIWEIAWETTYTLQSLYYISNKLFHTLFLCAALSQHEPNFGWGPFGFLGDYITAQ